MNRGRTKDAPPGSLTWREAFRTGVLHIFGGVCAIALLAAGVYFASEFFPHTRDSFRRFADAVFSFDDEPKTHVAVTRRAPAIAPQVSSVRPTSRHRALVPNRPEPTRAFVPPPAPPLPSPELVDDGPMILAVASFSTAVPETDFALPPRPGHPILRVLAVLAQPFRLLGQLFSRRHEPPRTITYEELGEPVE